MGGSTYIGTGYLKFAIVNANGDSTDWSNDATSKGSIEPTNGTFNILLGEISLTDMTRP